MSTPNDDNGRTSRAATVRGVLGEDGSIPNLAHLPGIHDENPVEESGADSLPQLRMPTPWDYTSEETGDDPSLGMSGEFDIPDGQLPLVTVEVDASEVELPEPENAVMPMPDEEVDIDDFDPEAFEDMEGDRGAASHAVSRAASTTDFVDLVPGPGLLVGLSPAPPPLDDPEGSFFADNPLEWPPPSAWSQRPAWMRLPQWKLSWPKRPAWMRWPQWKLSWPKRPAWMRWPQWKLSWPKRPAWMRWPQIPNWLCVSIRSIFNGMNFKRMFAWISAVLVMGLLFMYGGPIGSFLWNKIPDGSDFRSQMIASVPPPPVDNRSEPDPPPPPPAEASPPDEEVTEAAEPVATETTSVVTTTSPATAARRTPAQGTIQVVFAPSPAALAPPVQRVEDRPVTVVRTLPVSDVSSSFGMALSDEALRIYAQLESAPGRGFGMAPSAETLRQYEQERTTGNSTFGMAVSDEALRIYDQLNNGI